MQGTNKQRIRASALEILKSYPDGIRYTELVRLIQAELPTIPVNTIHGTVWNLDQQIPNEIYKPARGLWRHTSYRVQELNEQPLDILLTEPIVKLKEEQFYQPFADWLVNELEECTRAISLGRNKFEDKWGTPDVIGLREPSKGDVIQMPTEIVSAEIKLDTRNLITAFGQACSYKLFSHKCYIVVPEGSRKEDLARIDALCLIFGIGLILFDSSNSDDPKFDIRVRATKYDPDMFYVNEKLSKIKDDLWS